MHRMKAKKDTIQRTKLFVLKAMHGLVTTALFFYGWLLYNHYEISRMNLTNFHRDAAVVFLFGILFLFFSRTYNAYLFGYSRIRMLVAAQILSQAFSVVLTILAVSVERFRFENPAVFLAVLGVCLIIDIAFSMFGNYYFYQLNPPRRTILIYRDSRDKRRFGSITGKPTERLYQIVKEVRFDGKFSEIRPELEMGYDAVFVAGVNSHCRNGVMKYCEEKGISGFFLPHIGDVIMQGAEHIQSFDSPVMMVSRKEIRPEYRAAKRLFDMLLSVLGLVMTLPLQLLIAGAIKVYDHGPVFYRQERLTRDGKIFQIIKFRSMVMDAEKDGVARLSAGKNDGRVTPVGKILRSCRLDELPQLWNILKGDMSFVGPRPERPEIAAQYEEVIPEFRLRLQVKAGLTGYAQVYGKYNTDPYEKLEFDLMYISQMSVLTDLKLLFATAGILLSPESTKGTKGTTALEDEEE